MINNPERLNFQHEDFKASLDMILSSQLTPETIDSYAGDALDELVELTERITAAYGTQPTTTGLSYTDTENKAFGYFDLGELEQSLDHVADLAESIYAIDRVIKNATVVRGVIVPPDHQPTDIYVGDGSFGEKKTYDRLKTTLFILEKDFGIDIHDDERLQLAVGGTEGVMRDTSYSLLEVPELERTILVCDEEGNVSYVFDSKKTTDIDLGALTKSELNALINEHPAIGLRIVYSKNFIRNMKDGIHSIDSFPGGTMSAQLSESKYLIAAEELSPDYTSITQIANDFSLDRKTISRAINALADSLGEVKKGKSGTRITEMLSGDQRQVLREYFDMQGMLSPRAPEGYLSVSSMAQEWSLDYHTLTSAVGTIAESIGAPIRAKFSGRIADAYSPAQQAQIKAYLKENNVIVPEVPQGFMGVRMISNEYNISRTAVERAIETLRPELGGTMKAKFNARVADAYSPAQQEIIRNYLEQQGILISQAPEGFLSVNGMVEKFNLSNKLLKRVLRDLDDSIGETIQARFGSRSTSAYSPAQQEMILTFINKSK